MSPRLLIALLAALSATLAGCTADTEAASAEHVYRSWVREQDRFLRGEATKESTAQLLRLSSPDLRTALRHHLSGFVAAGTTQRGHARVTAFRALDAQGFEVTTASGGLPAAFAAEACVSLADVSYVDAEGRRVGQPADPPDQARVVLFVTGGSSDDLVVAEIRPIESDICDGVLR